MFSSIQEQNIHYLQHNISYARRPKSVRTKMGIFILVLIVTTILGIW